VERLAGLVRVWAGAAADLLFPPLCPVCGARADPAAHRPLCAGCWQAIDRLRPPWCAVCGRPFPSFEPTADAGGAPRAAELCGRCRAARPAVTWTRSAARYAGVAREAVHRLKFDGKTGLALPLGDLVVEACGLDLPEPLDLLVPVPLHPARERDRGFNQAALIAARLGRGLGLPLAIRAIRRVRPTRVQTELTAAERRANVREAFVVAEVARVRDRHVALVDDVLTTGATLAECARVLAAAGARSVGALTVARVV
jgi:ComF family protein